MQRRKDLLSVNQTFSNSSCCLKIQRKMKEMEGILEGGFLYLWTLQFLNIGLFMVKNLMVDFLFSFLIFLLKEKTIQRENGQMSYLQEVIRN